MLWGQADSPHDLVSATVGELCCPLPSLPFFNRRGTHRQAIRLAAHLRTLLRRVTPMPPTFSNCQVELEETAEILE
jgi:hypothetical protein